MVHTFLQTFQGRFLLSVLNQWMDETKRGVLSAILLDWGLYVCCLEDICCPVSPTVLLLVTNIAQFLNHHPHHHHLLSLPSVNHCLSPDTLISSTTESHQKRDQSEFNKQNQLCLTGCLLAAGWLGIVKTQNVKVNNFELKLTMRIFRGKSRR